MGDSEYPTVGGGCQLVDGFGEGPEFIFREAAGLLETSNLAGGVSSLLLISSLLCRIASNRSTRSLHCNSISRRDSWRAFSVSVFG